MNKNSVLVAKVIGSTIIFIVGVIGAILLFLTLNNRVDLIGTSGWFFIGAIVFSLIAVHSTDDGV